MATVVFVTLGTGHSGLECAVLVLALPFQSAGYRTLNPLGGTVDGDVEIRFRVFNHHILSFRQGNLNATAFVFAATWPVNVEKTDGDFTNIVTRPTKGKAQTPLGVLPLPPVSSNPLARISIFIIFHP